MIKTLTHFIAVIVVAYLLPAWWATHLPDPAEAAPTEAVRGNRPWCSALPDNWRALYPVFNLPAIHRTTVHASSRTQKRIDQFIERESGIVITALLLGLTFLVTRATHSWMLRKSLAP